MLDVVLNSAKSLKHSIKSRARNSQFSLERLSPQGGVEQLRLYDFLCAVEQRCCNRVTCHLDVAGRRRDAGEHHCARCLDQRGKISLLDERELVGQPDHIVMEQSRHAAFQCCEFRSAQGLGHLGAKIPRDEQHEYLARRQTAMETATHCVDLRDSDSATECPCGGFRIRLSSKQNR